MPWTHLPAIKIAILLATEQTIVPTVKIRRAVRITDLRPMIWEKDAQEGWKTVEQRRKLVPHQKAWIAVVPLRLVAMVLVGCQYHYRVYLKKEEFLTGRATESIVASIAQTKLRRAKQANVP
jgi:hypothetical protein